MSTVKLTKKLTHKNIKVPAIIEGKDIWNIDAKTGESIDNDDYEENTKGDY